MTAITVTGFFTQSSGNIVEVIGKLIRRYMIAGVLPMLEVETSNGRMHVAVEDATIEVEPLTEPTRYTTRHPQTDEVVSVTRANRDGIKWIVWARNDTVEGGRWFILTKSTQPTASKALASSKSTNPYLTERKVTEAIDTK